MSPLVFLFGPPFLVFCGFDCWEIYSVNYSFVRRQADEDRRRRRKSNGGFRSSGSQSRFSSSSAFGKSIWRRRSEKRCEGQAWCPRPGCMQMWTCSAPKTIGITSRFLCSGGNVCFISLCFIPPSMPSGFFFSFRVFCFQALETIFGVILDLPVWKILPVMSTSKG